MASVSTDKQGRKRILFVHPNGDRRAIWLGKVANRTAEATASRVEQLVERLSYGKAMSNELAEWVASLQPKMAAKLVKAGLIDPPEEQVVVKLGPWVEAYLESRADLKPATKVVRMQVIHDMNEFMGVDRDVRTITPGHADDFKQYLIRRELAPTTIHKRLQVARSFFNAMRRRHLIDTNPFEGVNAAATGIKDRQRFVTRKEIALVLEACPNTDWRCIVALARYGGLRCPSEVLSLRWQDIDWDAGRIMVTSPKTEHHASRDSRTIPLFPELKPILTEAFFTAPEGAEFVVDEKHRKAAMGANGWLNSNLRTQFQRIVKRAGLSAWPRLFHNLRASRETELVETFPVHVVTGWLGNTPKVAEQHYLMTTDEHFAKAVESAAEVSKKLTRILAQQAHAKGGNGKNAELSAHKKAPVIPGLASNCKSLQLPEVAGTGFEPVTSRL